MSVEHTKLRAGRYMYPVQLSWEGNYIYIKFGFNRTLMAEIKTFDGAHWCGYDKPPRKEWRIKANERNIFQLEFLEGLNPYEKYDAPLLEYQSKRKLYSHQIIATSHIITRRQCILAAEMGAGKTLAAIEAMEYLADTEGFYNWLWVAPKSVLYANKLEFEKWRAKIIPVFSSYASLHNVVHKQFDGVIFDESSRVKTPTSKRSKNAMVIATSIRNLHSDKGVVVEMSGTPAPRTPTDWYWQAEIACPGFFKEGNIHKFRNRLALVIQQEGLAGNTYPKLVTWYDKDNICKVCGEDKDSPNHVLGTRDYHDFQLANNEIKLLGERMAGLVLVQFKKDCLDLPDKQYRVIRCDTPASMKRAAKAIAATSPRAITALSRLRELSDGFQYEEQEIDEIGKCWKCDGAGKIPETEDTRTEEQKEFNIDVGEAEGTIVYKPCSNCDGSGRAPLIRRVTKSIKSPKEDVLKDVLDEHSDVGRLVIYAGFQGAVDKCIEVVRRCGWNFIKVDGRGWLTDLPITDQVEMLKTFQQPADNPLALEQVPLLAFIAQPGAGGMGLTLTASPTIFYYSNDFNGESRMQSEDRIHRPGMDVNRGATIIDCINLDSDEYILENIRQKKDLQHMPMSTLLEFINKKQLANGTMPGVLS